MFTERFKEVWSYRELLVALTARDIRVRYKQAAFGIAWAFFLPLLAILSGVVIRIAMAKLQGGTLPPVTEVSEVMIRSVLWLLFASAVGQCATSLISNLNLVTKIYFPREVLPLSALLGKMFDFSISVIGLIVGLVLLAVFSTDAAPAVVFSWSWLIAFALVLVMVFMIAGLGLALSTANVFFRDVKYIVEVLLRFGIFFSAVIIFVKDLPDTIGRILLLNPIVPLMEAISSAIVRGSIESWLWPWLGYSFGCTVLACMLGLAGFQRGEHLFAEYA